MCIMRKVREGERGRERDREGGERDEYFARESAVRSSFITSKGTKCYEQLEFLPKLPPLYHDRRRQGNKEMFALSETYEELPPLFET